MNDLLIIYAVLIALALVVTVKLVFRLHAIASSMNKDIDDVIKVEKQGYVPRLGGEHPRSEIKTEEHIDEDHNDDLPGTGAGVENQG